MTHTRCNHLSCSPLDPVDPSYYVSDLTPEEPGPIQLVAGGRDYRISPHGDSVPSPEELAMEAETAQYGHYFKDVEHLRQLDVYRVIELFAVPAGPLDHALKKILCAGGRGPKDQVKDVTEARDSLNRWLEMRREDAACGL